MIHRAMIFCIHQLKKLEFRLKTWRNGWAISRAYGSSSHRFFALPGRFTLIAGIAVAGIAVAAVILCGTQVRHHWAGTLKGNRVPVRTEASPQGVVAAPVVPVASADSTVIKHLWKPVAALETVILADKAKATLAVWTRRDTGWGVERSYPIALGARSGVKTDAGDLKTPEGTYFIVGYRDPSEIDVIYGPFAYVLDYPSPVDREAGRTGAGIWIHGSGGDAATDWSRGCLKMRNGDLRELSGRLHGGIGTPVVIVNDTGTADPRAAFAPQALQTERDDVLREYRAQQVVFAALVLRWKTAWESKDSTAYAALYQKAGFSGQGLAWGAWYEQKLRTFRRYPVISIGIDNIMVSDRTDSTVVLRFVQRYRASNATMINAKKLSLVRDNGAWLIIREYTIAQEELL